MTIQPVNSRIQFIIKKILKKNTWWYNYLNIDEMVLNLQSSYIDKYYGFREDIILQWVWQNMELIKKSRW